MTTKPGTRSAAPPRASVAIRALAAFAVLLVFLGGIWVAGGVLTNDFGLAMVLTALWIAVVGVVCAVVGWRSRRLRVPVIGAYLLTVAVVGTYLGRSMVLDDAVDEQVATATRRPAAGGDQGEGGASANTLLARGRFQDVAHEASGTASVIRRASGGTVLTLTSLEVDNGPDLRVYLVAGPARDESEVDVFEDLGALKGNTGDQQYVIPRGLDVGDYSTAVIWCRAFSVNFARAPLR